MYTHTDKTQKDNSHSVANIISQKHSDNGATFQFVDNRPEIIAQRKLKEMVSNHQGAILQKMKIRGAPSDSELSGEKHTKHVEPLATQATRARSEYGSRTFVANATNITSVVAKDSYDFEQAANARSNRVDFTANVDGVSLYMKTPPNLGADQPVNQTIDNATTSCEIGVIKNGEDKLQVVHFKIA